MNLFIISYKNKKTPVEYLDKLRDVDDIKEVKKVIKYIDDAKYYLHSNNNKIKESINIDIYFKELYKYILYILHSRNKSKSSSYAQLSVIPKYILDDKYMENGKIKPRIGKVISYNNDEIIANFNSGQNEKLKTIKVSVINKDDNYKGEKCERYIYKYKNKENKDIDSYLYWELSGKRIVANVIKDKDTEIIPLCDIIDDDIRNVYRELIKGKEKKILSINKDINYKGGCKRYIYKYKNSDNKIVDGYIYSKNGNYMNECKMTVEEKINNNLLNELKETEKNYINSLERSLKYSIKDDLKKNLNDIKNIQNKLLKSIEKYNDVKEISKILKDYCNEDTTKLYINYAKKLNILLESIPKKYISDLITPIQRIPRYELLWVALNKNNNSEIIKVTLENIRKLASEINVCMNPNDTRCKIN